MVSLLELERYLHELLMATAMKDSAPNGLQVEGKRQIRRVATAVTASLATIEEAKQWRADALIVHHGLFWNRSQMRLVRSLRDKVASLLEAELSLFAYHLPLDRHPEVGNNWVAAKELGVEEVEPFGEYEGQCIGVKGRVQDIEITEWVKKLELYYDHPAAAMLGGPKKVRSVACVSGGGHHFLSQVVEQGIDCLVTGSFDEPMWAMAQEEKKHFIALGHFNTEKVGPRALAAHLKSYLKIETHFIEGYNPF